MTGKLQRAHYRRQAAIRKTLLPCPKCGTNPEVDTGLLDAPYEPGFEFIWCPRIIIAPGIPDQGCGCYSQGAAAWNWRVPATGAQTDG
jgi:hypothetical protein